MKKLLFIIIISAQVLTAQTLSLGLNGGWSQFKSSPTLTYYYDNFSTLMQTKSTTKLNSSGPTAGLVLQLNSKSECLALTGEILYSQLQGKTDSLWIIAPPYS
ncbi:MAG TPA: hypothetical protein PLS75_05960 [Candidatus Marinimicrobia bacterium]|nr:hypothetical protein [Candidatus Neomarinimicrobiota bacterium]HQC63441.1 hypothetical protein [Candidatus Neomarinimicrobiota bacterium]